jgi:hypothetical protein
MVTEVEVVILHGWISLLPGWYPAINQTHQTHSNTVRHVLRDRFWDHEKVALYGRWPLKRGSIHMKFSMTGWEKGELLIQVTV